MDLIFSVFSLNVEGTWAGMELCISYNQGRRELCEAKGQNWELRPSASEASRKFWRSPPLDCGLNAFQSIFL